MAAQGAKAIGAEIRVVPATLTAVTAKDTWVTSIHVANVTGTAATLLVQDTAGTPLTLIPTESIAPNTAKSWSWTGRGIKLAGGLKWQAGTVSALHGVIIGASVP